MSDSPATPSISRWLLGLILVVGAGVAATLYVVSGSETPAGDRGSVDDGGGVVARVSGFLNGGIARFEEDVTERLRATAPRLATGAGPLRLEAAGLRWIEPGGPRFLDAAALSALFDAPMLARGDVVMYGARVDGPVLNLVQDSTGGPWNYERVLAPLLDGDDDEGEATRFEVRGLSLRDAAADVRMPDRTLLFRGLDSRLRSVELSGPALPVPRLAVASLSTTLRIRSDTAETVHQLVAEDALLRFRTDDVFFEVDRFQVGESRFADAMGIWDPDRGGYGVDATLRGLEVRLADVNLAGRMPERTTTAFTLAMSPLPGDRTLMRLTELSLRSPGSTATGELTAVIGGERPELRNADLNFDPLQISVVEGFVGALPYRGQLRGGVTGTAEAMRFDITAQLSPDGGGEPFSAVLRGEAALPEGAFQLEGLTGDLRRVPLTVIRPFIPNLPLSGRVTGTVSATGLPGRAPLDVDVNVEVARGAFTLGGTIDLSGAVPSYDLSGQMNGVELRGLFEPPMPPARSYFTFSVSGRGSDPRSATLRASAHGGFAGWRTEPGDTLAIEVGLSDGSFRIDDFRMHLGPVRLGAEGEWTLREPTRGGLSYQVVIQSLEPLGQYLPYLPPAFAQGRLATDGAVQGSIDSMRVSGSISGDGLRYSEWLADGVQGSYEIGNRQRIPRIHLDLVGRGVRAPSGPLGDATLALDVERPRFSFTFDADRPGGEVIEVDANGRIDAVGRRQLTLRRFEIDLQEQRWSLPHLAAIAWDTAGTLTVDSLRVVREDGAGLFALDGRVLPFEHSDFRFATRALPLGDVITLAGREGTADGQLAATARVIGSAGTPTVSVDFQLTDGAVRRVPVERLTGELSYGGGRLTGNASGAFTDRGELSVEVDLPLDLTLGVPPSASLRDGERLDMRVLADDVPLESLNAGARQIRELGGVLDADVDVSGTPDSPALQGSVRLRDGAARVVVLNERFTDITADLQLSDRRLNIRRLRATSGGVAQVAGGLTFDELTNPTSDLIIRFNGFRAQGVEDAQDASLWGELLVRGKAREPRFSGSLRLDDGTVFVSAFQRGPQFGDQLVGVAAEASAFGETLDVDTEGWFDAVRMDTLRLRMGDDLWVRTRESRLQLGGELRVVKPAEDLQVFGTLAGERGTFTLRVGPVVRRFEILRSQVRFFGSPEPNPGLDVTAARTIIGASGNPVQIEVNVQGTLNSPRLSLSTPDGVQVPESELLSFLVFGQPSFALGQRSVGGQDLIRDAAVFGGVSDLISIQIEEALISEFGLPLDFFQIRPGSFASGASVPTVVLGKEVADDLFLTVDAPLGALEVLSASFEWRINRELTLEAGREPFQRSRLLRGTGLLGRRFTDLDQQLFMAIRRRWAY